MEELIGARIKEIAERIKTLREIIGISEEKMAVETSVSLEEYKKLEAGEADFGFTFIYKCAQSFGVDVTDIIKGQSPTLSSFTLNRKGDGMKIIRRRGFVYNSLASLFKNRIAEPFLVVAPYFEEEQSTQIQLSTHVGQEFDIILKGRLKVQVGEHIEVLKEGDTIYYNIETPH
ncbi:MAG: helix-turn-helix domain-containing protein [Oscillospiraceae bacterium]